MAKRTKRTVGRVYVGHEARRIIARIRSFVVSSRTPVKTLSAMTGVSRPTVYKWLNSQQPSLRHATLQRVASRMGVPITSLWESRLHDTQALDALYTKAWGSYITPEHAESAAQSLLMSLLRHCYGRGWVLDYHVGHALDGYPSLIAVSVRRTTDREPCWSFDISEESGQLMLDVYVKRAVDQEKTLCRARLTRGLFVKTVIFMEKKTKPNTLCNGNRTKHRGKEAGRDAEDAGIRPRGSGEPHPAVAATTDTSSRDFVAGGDRTSAPRGVDAGPGCVC